MITILSEKEVDAMRRVGALAADTLTKVMDIIGPGVTTQEIDDFVVRDTLEKGCIAAPLGYATRANPRPFPKSVCTSVNEVVCHGIPSNRKLKSGDIVNVDVTHILDGWHGDTSATFMIDPVSDDVWKVVTVTRNALAIGISKVYPGARLGDIGAAIQEYVEDHGLSVVREFSGHGIGRKFHDEPSVFHHGKRDRGMRLKAGMAFTIEPMVNLGGPEVVQLDDGWTVVTKDGSPSAQFEHTVLVTNEGYEILTNPPTPL